MVDWIHEHHTRPLGDVVIHEQDLPPMALVSPTWRWASAGEPGDADTVLEADELDLTRALMSRRSAGQLRSWTTRGDVAPYLDAFTALGPLPEHDAG